MPDERIDKAKAFVRDRAHAYQTAFPKEGAATKAVLDDLAVFCRAHDSTFHPDPRIAAQLDGRREVYLRIMEHLTFTSDELWLRYAAGVKKGAT